MARLRPAMLCAAGFASGCLLTLSFAGVLPIHAWQDVPPQAEARSPAEPAPALPSQDPPPSSQSPLPVLADEVPSPAPTADLVARTETPADPEKAAVAFVGKTRDEATRAVDALTREAEQLRTRLRKVESALRRWKTLLAALGTGGDGPPPVSASTPATNGLEPPLASDDLVPVPPPTRPTVPAPVLPPEAQKK